MNDLLELLGSQLGGSHVERLSREIGADPSATAKAVETALPLLVGGLARNAASPQGAASLTRALDRDHRGDLLDNLGSLFGDDGGVRSGEGGSGGTAGELLGSLLGGGARSEAGVGSLLGSILGGGGSPKALDGAGILGHIFGQRQRGVENGVGRASGLDAAQVAKLLAMLAPLVMSALAKAKSGRQLDEGGLAGYLGQQQRQIERRTPEMKPGGLLGMLDRDNDGSIADDIAQIGVSLGGSLLSGRR